MCTGILFVQTRGRACGTSKVRKLIAVDKYSTIHSHLKTALLCCRSEPEYKSCGAADSGRPFQRRDSGFGVPQRQTCVHSER